MRMARAALLLAAGSALAAPPAAADTLKEALAEAYATNPTLAAQRAQLEGTDANVALERANGRPTANGSALYSEFIKPQGNSVTAPERQFGANISLSVPIYAGGSVENSIRASKQRVEAGRADLRGTESAIFNQVVAAYMDVIQNEAIVELSRGNVDVLTINLEATRDRFEIGDLTITDVAQSQARLSVGTSDLRTSRANLISARENYIQLVGSAPDDLQPPPPLPGLPASPDQAVEIALEHNPDLIAARERLQAAGFDIEVANASRLPRVEGFLESGYSNFLGSLTSDTPGFALSQAQTNATVGVRASVPLYQGGRPVALERRAQAASSAALEQAVATERSVIAQVRSAYASWQASLAIIDSTLTGLDAATLALEGVRAGNSVGNRTILDILDAQQELLRVQVQLVTARRNAYVAGFSLLAAMGRAEARDLGLDEIGPLYDPVANYDRVEGEWWDWVRDPDPVAESTRTVDTLPQNGTIPSDR